jgi:hypothetical protein
MGFAWLICPRRSSPRSTVALLVPTVVASGVLGLMGLAAQLVVGSKAARRDAASQKMLRKVVWVLLRQPVKAVAAHRPECRPTVATGEAQQRLRERYAATE